MSSNNQRNVKSGSHLLQVVKQSCFVATDSFPELLLGVLAPKEIWSVRRTLRYSIHDSLSKFNPIPISNR